VRTCEIKPTAGSIVSLQFISDVRTSLKLKHWNSFAVLKNMLMRLKQFQVFYFSFISLCAKGFIIQSTYISPDVSLAAGLIYHSNGPDMA